MLNVCDTEPTLSIQWVNVQCLLGQQSGHWSSTNLGSTGMATRHHLGVHLDLMNVFDPRGPHPFVLIIHTLSSRGSPSVDVIPGKYISQDIDARCWIVTFGPSDLHKESSPVRRFDAIVIGFYIILPYKAKRQFLPFGFARQYRAHIQVTQRVW